MKENNNEKRDIKIVKIVLFLLMIICIALIIYVLVNKNNIYHIDINNPNLIKTQNGYKEELIIEESTVIKKYIKQHKVYGQKINRITYNIMYYNEYLQENVAINVGKSRYDEFNVGDKIRVIRTVYYTNSGLRIKYEDMVEKK